MVAIDSAWVITTAKWITADAVLLTGQQWVKSILSTVTGGLWSYDYTGTTLSEGNHTFTAQLIDASGNVESFDDQVVTIDTTTDEPGIDGKTISITAISTDSGISSSDLITNDDTLMVSGTSDAADGSNVAVWLQLDGALDPTLNIDVADVLDMSGMNLFHLGIGWTGLGGSVAKHQVVVDGNAGDSANLEGGWTDTGTTANFGANTYQIYNANSSAAQILVDTDITTVII